MSKEIKKKTMSSMTKQSKTKKKRRESTDREHQINDSRKMTNHLIYNVPSD